MSFYPYKKGSVGREESENTAGRTNAKVNVSAQPSPSPAAGSMPTPASVRTTDAEMAEHTLRHVQASLHQLQAQMANESRQRLSAAQQREAKAAESAVLQQSRQQSRPPPPETFDAYEKRVNEVSRRPIPHELPTNARMLERQGVEFGEGDFGAPQAAPLSSRSPSTDNRTAIPQRFGGIPGKFIDPSDVVFQPARGRLSQFLYPTSSSRSASASAAKQTLEYVPKVLEGGVETYLAELDAARIRRDRGQDELLRGFSHDVRRDQSINVWSAEPLRATQHVDWRAKDRLFHGHTPKAERLRRRHNSMKMREHSAAPQSFVQSDKVRLAIEHVPAHQRSLHRAHEDSAAAYSAYYSYGEDSRAWHTSALSTSYRNAITASVARMPHPLGDRPLPPRSASRQSADPRHVRDEGRAATYSPSSYHHPQTGASESPRSSSPRFSLPDGVALRPMREVEAEQRQRNSASPLARRSPSPLGAHAAPLTAGEFGDGGPPLAGRIMPFGDHPLPFQSKTVIPDRRGGPQTASGGGGDAIRRHIATGWLREQQDHNNGRDTYDYYDARAGPDRAVAATTTTATSAGWSSKVASPPQQPASALARSHDALPDRPRSKSHDQPYPHESVSTAVRPPTTGPSSQASRGLSPSRATINDYSPSALAQRTAHPVPEVWRQTAPIPQAAGTNHSHGFYANSEKNNKSSSPLHELQNREKTLTPSPTRGYQPNHSLHSGVAYADGNDHHHHHEGAMTPQPIGGTTTASSQPPTAAGAPFETVDHHPQQRRDLFRPSGPVASTRAAANIAMAFRSFETEDGRLPHEGALDTSSSAQIVSFRPVGGIGSDAQPTPAANGGSSPPPEPNAPGLALLKQMMSIQQRFSNF